MLPEDLQCLFKPALDLLDSKGVTAQPKVLGKYTAVSVDGTRHFCTGKKGCPQRMVKNHCNGKKTYYHQLLAAVAVHPNQSTVFPVACEAIVKQDWYTFRLKEWHTFRVKFKGVLRLSLIHI